MGQRNPCGSGQLLLCFHGLVNPADPPKEHRVEDGPQGGSWIERGEQRQATPATAAKRGLVKKLVFRKEKSNITQKK